MVEIEAKLVAVASLSPARVRDRLMAIGCVCGAIRPVVHKDTYVDTDTDSLRRAGLAARVREGDRGRTVDVKPVPCGGVEGAIFRRSELRAACPAGDDPDRVLRSLLARHFDVAIEGPVRPHVVLDNDRAMFDVQYGDLRFEVSVDDVTASLPDRSQTTVFFELELEVVEGPTVQLTEIVAQLGPLGVERSGETKVERARARLGLEGYRYGPTPPDYDAQMPAVEVARRVGAAGLETLRAHELGARIGMDAEHVHAMRVTCRRLRVAASIVPDLMGGAFERDLRWLGRVLGSMRDLDVQMESLSLWRAQVGGPALAGWDTVRDHLRRMSEEARARMALVFDGDRYAMLGQEAQQQWAASADMAVRMGPRGAQMLEDADRTFSRTIRRFSARPDAARAHRMRIAAKRVRYTLALLWPMLEHDRSSHRVMRRLKRFQTDLGALQDAVAMGQAADAMAETALAPQAESAAPFAFVVGQLRGTARVVEAHGAWLGREAVERLQGSKVRRRVAKIVRRLRA